MTGYIILGILIILFVYGITLYNGLVSLKNDVAKSWSNIDVLLKQRHDELPKLVATCQQYMKYEQETLTKITEARASLSQAQASKDMEGIGKAEGELRSSLSKLIAVSESYPDLKASESFQHLTSRISGLETAISQNREIYNENVNELNIRIAQFPDNLIASRFHFQAAELLKFAEEEIKDVNIQDLFK